MTLPPFPAGDLSAAWPAVLGAALAAAALLAHRAGALRLRIEIPSGDVLVPVERLAGALWRRLQPAPEPHHHAAAPEPAAAPPGRMTVTLRQGEALLARWELAVLLVLVLALLVLAAVLGRGT